MASLATCDPVRTKHSAQTHKPVQGSLPIVRWACLGGLLLAEVIGFTLRFDSGSLSSAGWWGAPLRYASQLFQLASLIGFSTLGLSWTWFRREVRSRSAQCVLPLSWPALVGHFVTVTFFFLLTVQVLETDSLASPSAVVWVLVWMMAGCVTLASWCVATLPLTIWVALARRGLLPGIAIGCAAWGIGFYAHTLWRPLGLGTLWCVKQLLSLVTADIVCVPDKFIVGTSSFSVEIAPACSGYEGMALVVAFLSLYLWCARADLRFPRAFCILPLGVALIWLANGLRIAALIAIGTWGSPQVALGGFHSQVGWLTFIAVSLGLIALTQRSGVFTCSSLPVEGSNPAISYLLPLVVILATAMITGAVSSGFDWLYPMRVFTGAFALWLVRQSYAGWRWAWSWPAVAGGVAVFVLWLALEQTRASTGGTGELAEALTALPPLWIAVWLAFRVVGSVITIPLAEELALRGYVNRRLIASDFHRVPFGSLTWFSFIGSSLFFGALHDRWLAGTAAGMIYALVLYRRGRFTDAVLAHATTNALITIYVLTAGNWSLWA
jgi:exosortase E/protease (VPEID-CTERM system)